ncbi:hypothetical protein [Deinococcus gobiensis]|uniref:Uncharacterized protein n=1 Tax=Deinococcus gobiensis (strain DSM 21396 / JCM 16679 / CGMCC 1.7299 / I-0) TaxID=745776 RepID=H8GRX9_DEIGI|nr:hypothetical protein [Deinococcus gobiensis]AFD26370.1 hypothetical protein DGo_CA2443 [Deinococcus gobiensis I-0]
MSRSRTPRRPPPRAPSARFTATGRPKRRRHAFGWFSVALRIGLVLLLLLWGLILWHRLG